jgi:hypothetical protein
MLQPLTFHSLPLQVFQLCQEELAMVALRAMAPKRQGNLHNEQGSQIQHMAHSLSTLKEQCKQDQPG